jgi:hypothetical protein
LLKFFGINHRDEQIGEQREGNETNDDGFHKCLEFFAPMRVKFARHKKQGEDGDENQIQHNLFNKQCSRDERDNAATVLLGVNLRPRTSRIRGSPFQLPTRLADGLGLESGLEISCLTSFAPSSLLRILGLPHPAPGRKPDFGCNGDK